MFVIFRKYRRRVRIPRVKDDTWKIHIDKAHSLVKSIIEKHNVDGRFGVNRVSIRNQRSRWGSCSGRKNLNINYRIIFLPIDLAEYLVVHELCHLLEMNHSSKFWDRVGEILPNYKDLRKRLRSINMFKLDS